uniref:Type II holin n=1 Tax=Yersinia phage vB_YenP_WX2 TaxID=2973500 RepID=A0AAT9S8G5_9CAUD
MANVIKTVLTYPLDGSTRDFNIPFEYLARKFVVVTLIGVDRKVLTLNTDYRFATRTTISLTKAWGYADGYTSIEIRRVTSTTDRLVDFTDGSILRAYDLNVAQIQTMHVAEEARDLTADTIGVNNDGHLDARGRKIVNVADATEAGDAVSFGQMQRFDGSTYNSMIAAKASETNAKTSEMNSAASALSSKNEADRAKTEADRTNGKADEAAASATIANESAITATQGASTATTKAAEAKDYADRLNDFVTIQDRINSVAVSQVGDVEPHVSRIVAKPGTVYADGQLLSRAVYPSLWAKVDAGEVPVVDEAVWQSTPGKRGCYTKGTDGTNFRVPDYNGVSVGSIKAPVLRGDGGLTLGDIQLSGVPNVKGQISGVSGSIGLMTNSGVVTPPFELLPRGANGAPAFGYIVSSTGSGGNDRPLGFNLSLNSSVYQDGLTEARMNSVAICWVIRTHGVVNNPGSVDAAVLASRVEQVYTELLTRMIANENREKSGQKFLRRVFDYSTYGSHLGAGMTVTLAEDVLNKVLTIGAFPEGSAPGPTTMVYRCSPFIQPDTSTRMHITLGLWKYALEFPSANQITLVSADGGGVQRISFIDVVCDYPQS